jgi:hypothetical protein
MNSMIELIEKARKAQQEHDQLHDVQLEIPDWRDNGERRGRDRDMGSCTTSETEAKND